jgi:hypothetical protein
MTQVLRLRRFVSLGQKISLDRDSRPFGEGFNYWVEIGFPQLNFCWEDLDRITSKILSRIDHKAIGLDVHLGFEPTTAALAVWLKQELEAATGISGVEVKLNRGDGYSVTVEE